MKYAIAAALFLPLAAGANDGIGVVAAGGIVFEKTDAVATIFPMPAYPASVQVSDTYYGQPGGFSVTVVQPTSDLDVYFGNLEDAGASEPDLPRLNK
jgi:hypothetical protein